MLGLLELPAELRSMIYRLVIPKGTRFAYPVPITLYLGLFQSCRQLWHKEVLREFLCDAVVVHTLIGWHSLHDLVLSPVTPNISYLCIEIGMDLIQSLEDEHGVPFSEITPSYSRWLSEQQAGLAKWLGHFQSLRTLELKICFYRGDGKEVDIYIEGFFGSIDTSAEIIVSNGFGGSLGDGICLQIAEKLKDIAKAQSEGKMPETEAITPAGPSNNGTKGEARKPGQKQQSVNVNTSVETELAQEDSLPCLI